MKKPLLKSLLSPSSRLLLLALAFMLVSMPGLFGQGGNIKLNLGSTTIREALTQIEKNTNYVFFYADNVRPKLTAKPAAQSAQGDISTVMSTLLSGTGLSYEVNGNQISITESKARTAKISGKVVDEKGAPIPGVSVLLKTDQLVGTSTSRDGVFTLNVPNKSDILVFSFIGLEKQEIKFNPGTYLTVRMLTASNAIDNVVVETGIFQRDKISFTGSANTVSGSELRTVGNTNIIQSLKTLDPSFVVLDNMAMGSDPNTMPSIEMRGQSAATLNAITDPFSPDPNQPLFVLNGLEVPMQQIIDLDINRVESVTILKDAGSTAIYGSKGANGVIVIETTKPVAGELRVYYTGDFLVDAPDLSVFNMMNAAEKLEFERLSGKYHTDGIGGNSPEYQKALDALYANRLRDVVNGVDTYWLHTPVRTGFTHSHSLRVTTGHENLSVDAGAKVNLREGVMKGSDRTTWAGDVALRYRNKKLMVNNKLYVSGYDANNSKYGDFETWVNTSPYFKKQNDDGTIPKFLQYKLGLGSHGDMSSITKDIPNPYFNALLNNRDNTNQVYISNNLEAQYDFSKFIKAKAGLDLTRTHEQASKYISPEHTMFAEEPDSKKGYSLDQNKKSWSYRGYISGTYAQVFNELHSLTVNARAEISQVKNDRTGFEAEGFPVAGKGTPNTAYGYSEGQKPLYDVSKYRSAKVISAVNYMFDKRYLLDMTFSLDGASTFGSNKLFKPFWSVGVGWNINNENFAKDWTWVDMLKLRANTGISGNQNIGKVSSSSIYTAMVYSNMFGLGQYLSSLGNPDIPWQISRQTGIGLDFSGQRGRYTLMVDVYRKKTDPNIIYIPQRPSVGVGTYASDMGWLKTTGIDFIAGYSPIYNLEKRIIWNIRVTGAHYKSEYGGLSDLLDRFNQFQIDGSSMRQYRNGFSPNDIWAVHSLGIDPATGEEVFLKKDGTSSFEYDSDDMVVVGSSRPDLMGVVSTSLRYKNLSFNMSFRYSFGSDIYNQTLYNKVENISKSGLERNQDKRALYDRWKAPGDIAQFKAISIVESISPKTSRLVQKNNYLKAESISVSYELLNNPWVKRNLGMRSLKFNAYVNDIWRWETSKTERGYSYPFARSISLSINASF